MSRQLNKQSMSQIILIYAIRRQTLVDKNKKLVEKILTIV